MCSQTINTLQKIYDDVYRNSVTLDHATLKSAEVGSLQARIE